jgi:hypothetical protein
MSARRTIRRCFNTRRTRKSAARAATSPAFRSARRPLRTIRPFPAISVYVGSNQPTRPWTSSRRTSRGIPTISIASIFSAARTPSFSASAALPASSTRRPATLSSATREVSRPRVGSYGSTRGTIDVNQSLIDNVLAHPHRRFVQPGRIPAGSGVQEDKRIYGAIRWDP